MRKVLFYLLGVLTCLIIAAMLPIIPIQMAAVIPHPVFSLAFVSIIEFADPFRVGVSYHLQWYSVVSILVLFVVSGVIGVGIVRILMKIVNANKNAT